VEGYIGMQLPELKRNVLQRILHLVDQAEENSSIHEEKKHFNCQIMGSHLF